jgi:hypothetical protein
VILDTEGNIFGGFTHVEWESLDWNGNDENEDNCSKVDPSLKSYRLMLKNPHNVPARRFALKAEKKDMATHCNWARGPHFDDSDVSDACNTNTMSFTQR